MVIQVLCESFHTLGNCKELQYYSRCSLSHFLHLQISRRELQYLKKEETQSLRFAKGIHVAPLPPPEVCGKCLQTSVALTSHWKKCGLLATKGQRPGMPPTILQWTGQPPPRRSASPKMSWLPRLNTGPWAKQTRTELLQSQDFHPERIVEIWRRYPRAI